MLYEVITIVFFLYCYPGHGAAAGPAPAHRAMAEADRNERPSKTETNRPAQAAAFVDFFPHILAPRFAGALYPIDIL